MWKMSMILPVGVGRSCHPQESNYDIMTFVGHSKRKGSAMDKVASRDKKTAALSDILIYIEEQIQNWNIDLCAREAIVLQLVMQRKTACSCIVAFILWCSLPQTPKVICNSH